MEWLKLTLLLITFLNKGKLTSSTNVSKFNCLFGYDSNDKYFCYNSGPTIVDSRDVIVHGYHENGRTNKDILGLYVIPYKLCRIPRSIFISFPNLEEFIYICHNYVGNCLDAKALFKGLFKQARNLFDLNLRGHKFKVLPAQAFDGATKLRNLDLNGNHIWKIKKKTFQGLNKLNSLSLANNPINLPPGIFDDLPNLKHLSLFMCNLKRLPKELFRKNTKLQNIDLRNNKIVSVAVQWKKVPQLKNMNMKNNFCISEEFVKDANMDELENLTQTCPAEKISKKYRTKIDKLRKGNKKLKKKLNDLKLEGVENEGSENASCNPDKLRKKIKNLKGEIEQITSAHKSLKNVSNKRRSAIVGKKNETTEISKESLNKQKKEEEKLSMKQKFDENFVMRIEKLTRSWNTFNDDDEKDINNDEEQFDNYTSQINRKFGRLLEDNKALKTFNENFNKIADELVAFDIKAI